MGLGDVSLACAAALVDALAHRGVRHACLSPGSRSTPLALALDREDRIRTHMHLDERSAAFFALGIAKATGAPAALACTSGTAAAEYLPAVVEASQSRTPIVALTADRPPRLRGTGANQTIDQTDLYGRYARAYLEPPVPANAADVGAWHDTGIRAVAAAVGTPAGPVHVNCPFDEPLVPEGVPVATPPLPADETEREDRGIEEDAARESLDAFLETYAGRRGVITLGPLPPPRTLSLLTLGALLGWPVLAEPLSGLRLDAGGAGRALAAGQLLIGDPGWLERHRPDVVLQVGAAPTTRPTQTFVAGSSLVVLDREHLDPDPEHRAERRILVDPELFAAVAWNRHAEDPPAVPGGWLEAWRQADLLARASVDRVLDPWIEPFEGRVARDLAAFLPHGAVLCIGSSSPVRDLDTFMAPRRPPRVWTAPDLLRVVGNRGASGIDGFISTALGVAVAGTGPTYVLMGDLTFLHDAGALLWSGRAEIDLVVVVLANGGGELFSLLPQRELPELRELFVTPHRVDLGAVSAAAGVGHERVLRSEDLLPAVQRAARARGIRVVEVMIDPERGRDRRAEVRAAVARTLTER
jgi:2-succinyl-5-enolpyruvyl-6-hydroxy-3-cyclohexene-1-carboxylate synthase